jgi:hypothetical protein
MQNLLGGLIQVHYLCCKFITGIPYEEDHAKRRKRIKVANEVQAEVEAIGDLSLVLYDGFILKLSDVLYVSSLRRNLISVSHLDDDGYDYHFGNGKCQILINNKYVGLAF